MGSSVGTPNSFLWNGALEILRPASPLLTATGLWVCLAASVEGGFGDTQTSFSPRNDHRAVGLPCNLSGRLLESRGDTDGSRKGENSIKFAALAENRLLQFFLA